jgi:hypothetical protein
MDENAAPIFFGEESKIHLAMKTNCGEQYECILLVPHREEKDQSLCTFWVLLSVSILRTDKTDRNVGGILYIPLGL